MTKTKVHAKLRAAYAFFKEHAGCREGRRAAYALALAKSEQEAKARGWRVLWQDSPEGCTCDWQSIGAKGPCRETLDACLYAAESLEQRPSKRWHLASLGSICEPTKEYARVVEAELASEALADIGAAPDRWTDPEV